MTSTSLSWSADVSAESTAYRVFLWGQGSLPDELLAQWQQKRKSLLQSMQDAGVKGARGRLKSVESELESLTVELIEKPLLTASYDELLCTRASASAEAMRSIAGLLGYELRGDALILLLELQGEQSLPDLISACLGALALDLPQGWCDAPLIKALSAEMSYDLQTQWGMSHESSAKESEEEAQWQHLAERFEHFTVMAEEASNALLACEGKLLIDATLGGGGHTQRLLEKGAEVWGIDQDPVARTAARKRLAGFGERFRVLAGNFRDLGDLLSSQGVEQVDGILADIGISSPQVDCAERGFSFMQDGPLDMRMNPEAALSAADLIAQESEQALADILWQYGEERASRAIARRIVREREVTPITTTSQLANIIASVLPRKGKQHPATRSFQALRIAVNDELGALQSLLEEGVKRLRSGGRMAIITFHSLEDRAVKRFFERITKPEVDRPEWPAPRPNPDYCAKLVVRKPLVASEQELSMNSRSRSAKLRIVEKI